MNQQEVYPHHNCNFSSSALGRFRVDDVTQDQREDCYLATLHINHVDVQDSRPYYLVVENERGADRAVLILKVEGLFPGSCIQKLFENIKSVRSINWYQIIGCVHAQNLFQSIMA